MRRIKEYINEALLLENDDVLFKIVNESHSAKYYTVKQAIALLKKNLEGIETEDDKAYAVYNALGEKGIYLDQILTGSGSKIIVKDVHYDSYGRTSQKTNDKLYNKYQAIFDEILEDPTISSLYEKGKNIQAKKLKEAEDAKREAERLAKNKAYKDVCDSYPGLHLLFKAFAFESAYENNNLWTTVKNSLYSILIKGCNKCKSIKASEAEVGKVYLIATDTDSPNLLHKKDFKPTGRWDIINIMSVVKCVGDDKWNIVMSRKHYGYTVPDIEATKVEKYFDTDPALVELDEYLKKNTSAIEEGIERYTKMIKDDMEFIKKEKLSKRYSSLIVSLLDRDEIA